MSVDLKILSKPEKMKIAEKHLNKYVNELKRHFDFSDLQVIKLLEKSCCRMKSSRKESIISAILNIFNKKIFK